MGIVIADVGTSPAMTSAPGLETGPFSEGTTAPATAFPNHRSGASVKTRPACATNWGRAAVAHRCYRVRRRRLRPGESSLSPHWHENDWVHEFPVRRLALSLQLDDSSTGRAA